jgi:putative tryptophan/tyrosine transport system substrate-binding protein
MKRFGCSRPTALRRRVVVGALAAAGLSPCFAHAQPQAKRRIGVLTTAVDADPLVKSWIAAFQEGLRAAGWRDGENAEVAYRRVNGSDAAEVQQRMQELLAWGPEVILGMTEPVVRALRRTTSTIPIVFVMVGDPVASGLVENLARPGGNITGFSAIERTLGGAWAQYLKEIAPATKRIAVLLDPNNPEWIPSYRVVEAAASSLGVQPAPAPIHGIPDIESALEALAKEPDSGVVVLASTATLILPNRRRIIAEAERHRLPAIYPYRPLAVEGGLLSYGPNIPDTWRRAAGYIDRILKGEKPADLPVQNPSRFELVVNLKTASALGLDVPASILARADEVIE